MVKGSLPCLIAKVASNLDDVALGIAVAHLCDVGA